MRISLVDAATIAALALAALLVAVPRLRVEAALRREDQVVADLNDLARRLDEVRKAGVLDTDGDGRGEYPGIEAILGSRREQAAEVGPGVWDINGYRFAVLVPGSRRLPVLAGTAEAVADYAEVAWMIVGWPAEPGVTGMRAYATTTYGVLLHKIDGYPYGESPPFPDCEMIVQDGARVRRADQCADDNWTVPVRNLDRSDGRPVRRTRPGDGK